MEHPRNPNQHIKEQFTELQWYVEEFIIGNGNNLEVLQRK